MMINEIKFQRTKRPSANVDNSQKARKVEINRIDNSTKLRRNLYKRTQPVIHEIFKDCSTECRDFVHKYWSGQIQDRKPYVLYNTCYKGMSEMFVALITNRFSDFERELYTDEILKKIGYLFGTAEGRKIKKYIKDVKDVNDVKGMNNLAFHIVFAVMNINSTNTLSVIDTNKKSTIYDLKCIWEEQNLITPSSVHHPNNYYQVRLRNKKILPVLKYCNVHGDQGFLKQLELLKSESTSMYLNRNMHNLLNNRYISLETMVILGYILRVLTTVFKMNKVLSKEYREEVLTNLSDYFYSSRNDIDVNDVSVSVNIDVVREIFTTIAESEYILNIASIKMSEHKKRF